MLNPNILSELNEEQKRAVENIYGTTLVVAGPGTGKTHMLTTRIAYILTETDAVPENILCLTFTNTAAVEMRNRLQKKIGVDAYRVKIFTFHGFCEWVMEKYPENFDEHRKNREIADDLQKALAYRETIESKKWENFWHVWDPFFAQKKVLSAISKLKRENITPKQLQNLIPAEKEKLENNPENFYKKKFGKFQAGDFKPSARKKIDNIIDKMTELAALWAKYDEVLDSRGFFDFDDQIMWVVNELTKNENLRLDLQENFQWILVDEYQDTNASQNKILWELTSFFDDPNLFVVGDDDQSIYRFQGASIENIIEFKEKFPKCNEIFLTQNYRSAPNILEAAYKSISRNTERICDSKNLVATGENKKFSGDINKIVFGSKYLEINFLVDEIKKCLAQGIKYSQIAILVRKNSEVIEIAQVLPKFGIPIYAQIFQNIFDDEAVKYLIIMLEIFGDPKNDEKIFELLHSPFLDIPNEKLLQWSLDYDKRENLFSFLSKKTDESEKLKQILDFFITSRKKFWHCRPEVLAEKLFYESGLAKFLIPYSTTEKKYDYANAKTSSFFCIRKFFDWTKSQKCNNLAEILDRIYLHQKLDIPVRPDKMPVDKKSINIFTAHKAKGQEFDIVFVPGLEYKKWGNNNQKRDIVLPDLYEKNKNFDENEEERRLFFVALTRARKKIFLSYSTVDFSGREKAPSLFWHEIPEKNSKELENEQIEKNLQELLPIFLSNEKEFFFTDEEKNILYDCAQNFVWSASSLQNFLDCPRKFLYQNLYNFPRRPVPQMAFGASMHEALEKFFRYFQKNKTLASKEILLSEYQRALRGQNLEKKDFEKLLDHGNQILDFYFETNKNNFSDNNLLEFNFGKFSPVIEDIRVKGFADRIEFLDQKKQTAKIVDYKSGKPKSIKSGERIWRQLVFYDLLVKNISQIPWKIEYCEIEFLSPDANGKLQKKSLEVSDEDRKLVIQELKTSHKKLLNLEFELVPNPTNDPEIDFWQNFRAV